MSNTSAFDPKIHICKFGFELYDHCTLNSYEYKILGDLYSREISIIFTNKRTDDTIDAVGFNLSDEKINSILPFIVWDDFEKMRDVPDGWYWDLKNGNNGYRDGWGYRFWCLSESGMPLIQRYLSSTFDETHLPPDEKLLNWLRKNYRHRMKNNMEMMW